MLVQDLEGLRSKVLIAPKVNPSRLEKEHPPLVVIGDVGLVWRNALERGKVVVALQYLFEFGLDNGKVILKFFSQREVVGVKVLLIPQQAVLVEGLL